MKKDQFIIILLCIITLSLLSGCGKKAVSDSQLQSDLYNSVEFSKFSVEFGMEITNLEIIKRQTAVENKFDRVWISVDTASNTVEGKFYYIMIYNLYNDGWLLESVIEDKTDLWHFAPISGISDEEVSNYLPKNAEILSNEIDLENATQIVTYTYAESYRYCNITYNKQLMFVFEEEYHSIGKSSPGEWGFDKEIDIGSYEEWHINGTWQYVEDVGFGWKISVLLTLDDFSPGGVAYTDPGSNVFDVPGKYEYKGLGSISRENGPISVSFSVDDNNEVSYFIGNRLIRITRDKIYLYHSNDELDKIS